MTQAFSATDYLRAKSVTNPLVKELCSYIDELNATIKQLRDAAALDADTIADLRKDNAALRADLRDTKHDLDATVRHLNRRDSDGDFPT